MTRNIVLFGEKGIGKTTVIRSVLAAAGGSPQGFFTRRTAADGSDHNEIRIFPAADPERSDGVIAGVSDGKSRNGYPEIFDSVGVFYLENGPGRLIVMDELGTLEKNAQRFQACVMRCLDGDIPVIAAIKKYGSDPFLEMVKSHKKTLLVEVTEENRTLLAQLLAVRMSGTLTVGILCGGKSTRMGTDKAALPAGKNTVLQMLIDRFSLIGEVVLSVGGSIRSDACGCRQIEDRFPDCGPLGGICSVLERADTDKVLFVPCDVPFFSLGSALLLYSELPDTADAIVAEREDGEIEPLLGIYRKSLLPVIREKLKSGAYSVREMLSSKEIRCIRCKMIPSCEIINMNTPDEYAKYLPDLQKREKDFLSLTERE